ncbi:glycosyltransferase family 4 protein [Arthrobacter sp. CP30]
MTSEVWVLTRKRFRDAITRRLDEDQELARWLHPVYIDLPDPLLRLKRSHRDVYWYYPLWQRLAGRTAGRLHSEHRFDVAHHVTFAVDWMPCGLASLPPSVPLIWGPVGGATSTPVTMYPALGVSGVASELVRRCIGSVLRRAFGDSTASRAALVVALNDDVRRRFEHRARVVVEPNAALMDQPPAELRHVDAPAPDYRAVFIGRLVTWKGTRLALQAVAEKGNERWRLDYYGEGADRRWLERQVLKRGLSDRVRLHGQVPRAEIFRVMREADLLLFPSMHDSAPWTVAEASTLGLPAVVLDLGGPAHLAGRTGIVVPRGARPVPRIARALASHTRTDHRIADDRWSVRRLPEMLDGWYESVTAPDPRLSDEAAGTSPAQESVTR